jgi:hypothetical protein
MLKLLKKFSGLSRYKKVLLVEAFARAMIAMAMIKALPYSFWRRWLGDPVPLELVPRDSKIPDIDADQNLRDMYWAYSTLSRHARFLTCLMLGFSARALMQRRGLKSVMVLGVERESAAVKPSLNAHAWVVHQSFDIAGGLQKPSYTAVAAYSIKSNSISG